MTEPQLLPAGHPDWRKAFEAKLAHDRAIAPTPTPAMVRAFAVERLRSWIASGRDPDDWMEPFSGSFGPARDGKPAFAISGPISFYTDGNGVQREVRKGHVFVELGERGGDCVSMVFRVRDLIPEARSGAMQLDLFGGAV